MLILLYRSIFVNILQKAQFINNTHIYTLILWFFLIMPTNFVYRLYQSMKMPIDCRSYTRFSLSYSFILKFPVSPVKFTASTAANVFIFNFFDATADKCLGWKYVYFISRVVCVCVAVWVGKCKNDVTINLSNFSWICLFLLKPVPPIYWLRVIVCPPVGDLCGLGPRRAGDDETK